MVHSAHAINGDDQLRQRVGWALSQIYIISEYSSLKGGKDKHEFWTSYYDILVRHAFGNLMDILREVSYSPSMASFLTFHNIKVAPTPRSLFAPPFPSSQRNPRAHADAAWLPPLPLGPLLRSRMRTMAR